MQEPKQKRGLSNHVFRLSMHEIIAPFKFFRVMHTLTDYDYTLPQELIAQTPTYPPESCKLLVYDRATKTIEDHSFYELPNLLSANSLLVFNDSKVIKARLPIRFDAKKSEMKEVIGEIFFLRLIDPYTFEALIRPGRKFRVGSQILLPDYQTTMTVLEQTRDGRILRSDKPILNLLDTYGQMPLPPYITYEPGKSNDYQPFFAQQPGSVAAPTASLHFTPDLLKQLKQQGISSTFVTLHVGLGTFKQVDTEDITAYEIHTEQIELSTDLFTQIVTAKQEKRNITAIGTTVTRTLETMPYVRKLLDDRTKSKLPVSVCTYRDSSTEDISLPQATSIVHSLHITDSSILHFDSQLFLYPGKSFHVIDQLITNFHLPKSSLLMLVAAYIGFDEMKRCYSHAITSQYRFYSFGDAMRIK